MMIDPLYDGDDEKYGDGRHLDPDWQHIRQVRSEVVNPETGLSWARREMAEEIRKHLTAVRERLWEIRHACMHHDNPHKVIDSCIGRTERIIDILGYIPLYLNALEKHQEKLESMLYRVVDELQDPMAEHWCDRPAEDRKLLESLRDDLLEMLKERP
jgi:hypothetical protein